MKTKKLLAVMLATAMFAGAMTGCGAKEASKQEKEQVVAETNAETEAGEAADTTSELAGVEITFLNSKGEIQEAMEEMAV